jgi:hypothetical protein
MADDPKLIRKLSAGIMRPLGNPVRPVVPPDDRDLDNAYWHGYSVVGRRATKPDIDRPIVQMPMMEREPESAPPQTPVWVNGNCPPWICPPAWAVPVELTMEKCIPFYEQATLMDFCFTVPQDYVLVIRNLSWEALNAVQYDVFQFDFLVDGSTRLSIEDMLIAPGSANPAHKYALAGHTRPMPTHLVVDRNHTLCIRAILRGPIDFAGNSPFFPGQPIVTANCLMKVVLQGWLANLRENVDGGPRPTDLGDGGGFYVDTHDRDGTP